MTIEWFHRPDVPKEVYFCPKRTHRSASVAQQYRHDIQDFFHEFGNIASLTNPGAASQCGNKRIAIPAPDNPRKRLSGKFCVIEQSRKKPGLINRHRWPEGGFLESLSHKLKPKIMDEREGAEIRHSSLNSPVICEYYLLPFK